MSSKAAKMYSEVSKWEKSGMTQREFSSIIGVSRNCFGYWVRKKREHTAKTPQFVELVCDSKSARKISEPQDKQSSPARIDFDFPNGMSIKVYL